MFCAIKKINQKIKSTKNYELKIIIEPNKSFNQFVYWL